MTNLPQLEVANATFVTPRLVVGGDLDQYDDELASAQLAELVAAGVTHLLDARVEADDSEWVASRADVEYLWPGMDDAGQRVPASWFDTAVEWALTALDDPDAVVLTHCHMGINRGPSLGFAVLLAQGVAPVEAITAIREARPIAAVAYAEDALRWHHDRRGVPKADRKADRAALKAWRRDNPLDVVRIIAQRRRAGA